MVDIPSQFYDLCKHATVDTFAPILHSPNVSNENLAIGLSYACLNHNMHVVKLLIKRGAPVGCAFKTLCTHGYGYINEIEYICTTCITGYDQEYVLTGFIVACSYGHLELVKYIYATIRRINLELGLWHAAEYGQIAVVQWILTHPSLDVRNALYASCQYNQYECMRLILKYGVDKLTCLRVLSYACSHSDITYVSLLLSHIEHPRILDIHVRNACKHGSLPILKLLAQHCDKALLHTGLQFAASGDVIRYLIDSGASPDHMSPYAITILRPYVPFAWLQKCKFSPALTSEIQQLRHRHYHMIWILSLSRPMLPTALIRMIVSYGI
jgi:ankyrin repeat protein